jgi:UDP-N-acetylglucosamine--N-acetylmuramyl-(pentapeptide) pyrophosphoryl-undecaprenol N-acetylglucosamine transferase
MRIVVSGGGTGGHIFPALAVCEGLRRRQPDCELLYIGSITGMEGEIVPKTGIPYQAVTARKLRKLVSVSTLGVGLSLIKGFQEARTYLRAFKADVVVGTGGYVAGAAVLAGASLKIPTVILAPDSIPGRTNLMLARFARRICVVFEESVARFPAGKTVITGLPLREGVIAPPDVDRAQARCAFDGLTPDRFTILVIGGSQGSRNLNQIVVKALPEMLAAGMQVLHQTGPNNFDDVCSQVRALGLPESAPHCPVAFLNEQQVPLAYRAADVMICRGGISTLSEVMANSLPAIIVPLPTAYADHQTANARAMERQEAAICRPERELSAERLVQELAGLQSNQARLAEMARAARRMSQPDATGTIADLILGLGKT